MPLVASRLRFETLFEVSPRHRLELVSSRSRGGLFRGTYWDHEEYDESGRLLARYQSASEVSLDGAEHSGWRKYDASGRLLAEGSFIPSSIEEMN